MRACRRLYRNLPDFRINIRKDSCILTAHKNNEEMNKKLFNDKVDVIINEKIRLLKSNWIDHGNKIVICVMSLCGPTYMSKPIKDLTFTTDQVDNIIREYEDIGNQLKIK